LNFFFNEVIQQANYPIIYTDVNMVPQYWRNVDIPKPFRKLSAPDTVEYVQSLVKEYLEINLPIPISYDGQTLGYYVYGESLIIRQLRWLPVIEIAVVALFILIGYAGFNSIKRSEERFIWVGMAKETAHQLGTPLSSLLGWLEYLKSSPGKLGEVIPELEKDLYRLQIITNRFSQIGSLPHLEPQNLDNIVSEIVQYFKNRLPQKNGKIHIESFKSGNTKEVMINRDLFSWVIENLVKNALDAIGDKSGKIRIHQGELNDSQIFIDVEDTGKGIIAKNKKNIFKPGFSTKKRGWGLGLSLTKRIIEDYHGGKLQLKESQLNEGSTFRMILSKKLPKKTTKISKV
jgi:signal transduction histidine kinase